MLAQHHFGIIPAVIDDGIVQAAITGTWIYGCIRQIVPAQHINDNIRSPTLFARLTLWLENTLTFWGHISLHFMIH